MWQINESYDWEHLRRNFSWVRAMQGVPQDPLHHAEGDVEVHTRLVLEALEGLAEFRELPEQEQHLLRAAALLHDVEKRSTTVQEADGRITSRGHAVKGALSSRQILYLEVPTPFPMREQITGLVRHHGLPLWVFDHPDPRKAVIAASLEVNTQLLALLATADVLGRGCSDQEDLLYRIELFRELCREWDCYGKPRGFADDFSRFFYLQREEVAPDYVAYNDSRFEVVLLSGLPGSGKDMWVNYHLSNWPVISPDELRQQMKIKPNDKSGWGKVQQRAKEKAKEYMRQHRSFVWNAPNLSKLARQALLDLFFSYGAWVRIVYLEVPYAQLQLQNSRREEPLSGESMARGFAKWEIPSPTEAHQVEYVIQEALPVQALDNAEDPEATPDVLPEHPNEDGATDQA